MKLKFALFLLCLVALPLAFGQDNNEDENSAEGEDVTDGEEEDDEDGKSEVFTGQCVKCNSVYDDDCVVDKPGAVPLSYSVDCSKDEEKPTTVGFPDGEPVGCRQIEQEVPGGIRTIRQCAYSGDIVHGLKRTGSKGVRMWYYHCSTDNCNGAAVKSLAVGLIALCATINKMLR